MRFIRICIEKGKFVVYVDGLRSEFPTAHSAMSEAHAAGYMDKQVYGDQFRADFYVTRPVLKALKIQAPLRHMPIRVRGYDYL